MNAQRDLRGRWPGAILSLLASILFVLTIRWALLEPVVIPSGSMIPTLLIHDYVLINKFAFGLRIPFSQSWLMKWKTPVRGEVIVFQSPQDKAILLIKRVIGLPGEKLEIDSSGQVLIDDRPISLATDPKVKSLAADFAALDSDLDVQMLQYDQMENDQTQSLAPVAFAKNDSRDRSFGPIQIPDGHFFMMGDNRDHSYDARAWGAIPFELIQGRAVVIWMSCEDTLQDMPRMCDPLKLRGNRFLKMVR